MLSSRKRNIYFIYLSIYSFSNRKETLIGFLHPIVQGRVGGGQGRTQRGKGQLPPPNTFQI